MDAAASSSPAKTLAAIWPPVFGCAWACFFTSPPFNYIKPKNKDFLTSVYQANKQKWILILLKPTYAVGYKSSWPQCLVCWPCFAKLVPYIRIQKFYPSPKTQMLLVVALNFSKNIHALLIIHPKTRLYVCSGTYLKHLHEKKNKITQVGNTNLDALRSTIFARVDTTIRCVLSVDACCIDNILNNGG